MKAKVLPVLTALCLLVTTTGHAAVVVDRNPAKMSWLLNNRLTMVQIKSALAGVLPGETLDLVSIEWLGTYAGFGKVDDRYSLTFSNFMHTSAPTRKCIVAVTVTEVIPRGPTSSKFTLGCN